MKKKNAVIFGLTAAALAFIMVLAGCPDSGGSSTGPSGPAYSGKFGTGSEAVTFELDNTGSNFLSASRAAAGSNKLTGKLRDASGVYQLSGSYDTSGAFNLSADDGRGSNTGSRRYRVSGAFGRNGKVLAANALVDKKNISDSSTKLTAFKVTDDLGASAIGGGGAEPVDPIPAQFLGTWVSDNGAGWGGGYKGSLLLSSYSMSFFLTLESSQPSHGTLKHTDEVSGLLVEKAANGNGVNVIFVMPGMDTDFDSDDGDDLDAVFQAYLEDKGWSAERLADDDVEVNWSGASWTSNTTKQEYAVRVDGIYCHNFDVDSDWLILLDRWRNEDGITCAYMKFQFWIEGDTLKQRRFGDGDGSFATLAAARDATSQGGTMTYIRQQ